MEKCTLKMNPKQTAFELLPPVGESSGPITFGDDDYVLVVDPDTSRSYIVVGDGEAHGLKDNTVYALTEVSTLIETRPDEDFADADEDEEDEEDEDEEGDEEDEDDDDEEEGE